MSDPRHSFKLMLFRKSGKKPSKKHDIEEKYAADGLPYEIYGEGLGLEDISKLYDKFLKQTQKNSNTDDDWEEVEPNKKDNKYGDDSDDEIDVDEEFL